MQNIKYYLNKNERHVRFHYILSLKKGHYFFSLFISHKFIKYLQLFYFLIYRYFCIKYSTKKFLVYSHLSRKQILFIQKLY